MYLGPIKRLCKKKFSFNYPYCKRKPGVLHIVYYRLETLFCNSYKERNYLYFIFDEVVAHTRTVEHEHLGVSFFSPL